MEQLARGWSRKSDLASTFTLPLNKTLDHRVPAAHRNKRGCEKGREREREERRTGGPRGRITGTLKKDQRWKGGRMLCEKPAKWLLSWFNEGNKGKESKSNVKKRDEEAQWQDEWEWFGEFDRKIEWISHEKSKITLRFVKISRFNRL